jgi:hypothetical protein
VVLAAKLPLAETTGAFGPSPSKSLDVRVITCPPAVNVVVTVVITSSSLTGPLSSLLHDTKNIAVADKRKVFVGFKYFMVFKFLIINF